MAEEHEGNSEGLEVRLTTVSGRINSDLTVGADVTTSLPLRANAGLSCRGVSLHGGGFIVTPDRAREIGLGRIQGLNNHIRLYRNGRDLTSRARQVMVIDLFGLSSEEVRSRFPEVYQHVVEHVKPERDQNNRDTYKNNWWILGEPRRDFRPALVGLPRFIATVETSKHRFFVFLDATILPDNMLVKIALDDAFFLGVLSSKIHVVWALASGGTLEDRPRYNKTRCFEPFPFPICDDTLKAQIRELGERLDAHRKKQLAGNAGLSMTDMYNVLSKLRSGEILNAKDKLIHEQGLISILRELHDELDLAVAEAYGWPHNLSEEEILQRLVSLNRERIAAEASGQVHWLRPEFQMRDKSQVPVGEIIDNKLETETETNEAKSDDELSREKRGKPSGKTNLTGKKRPTPGRSSSEDSIPAGPKGQTGLRPWPKALLDQVRGVASFLSSANEPLLIEEIAKAFKGARIDRVTEILDTLVALGRARRAQGRPSRESGSRYRSA
ncbi:MAG: type IIL restriction-modification enzyme MmeI [Candidatus Ozemobacteraceae bacterium]